MALVTLGCARNEVDSEELAGRLAGDGWQVTSDADGADLVLVNTCGFVAEAQCLVDAGVRELLLVSENSTSRVDLTAVPR